MAKAKLPLFSPLDIGTDEFINSDQAEITNYTSLELYNVFLNDNKFAEKRPSFLINADYDTQLGDNRIHGCYWWSETEKEYYTADKKLYVKGGSTLDTTATGELSSTIRPMFTTFKYPTGGNWVNYATSGCSGENVMAVAGGGKIMLYDGAAAGWENPTGAPTAVTHVGYVDGQLVCNEVGEQRMWWSDILDPFNFTATNFVEAEGIPDDVVALHVLKNQVYLFGKESIEIFYNDGTGFIPARGQAINMGCTSPYSIQEYNNAFIFLNNKSEVVALNNGQASIISNPVSDLISFVTHKSTIFGMIFIWQGRPYYILQVPKDGSATTLDGFTLAYDLRNGGWYQWSIFRDDDFYEMPVYSLMKIGPDLPSGYNALDDVRFGSDHGQAGWVNLPESSGSDNYFDDDDAKQTARTYIRTTSPIITHGTYAKKICRCLRFRLKGDESVADIVAKIEYRDDMGSWNTARNVTVNTVGKYYILTQTYQWGTYRARQWRFVIDESYGIAIGDIEEVFEILEE